MALPPSKSPSSLSLLANTYSSKFHNPNRRSSEITDPVRRSFKDNPFTKTSTAPTPRRFGPSAPPKDYPARRRDSISCTRECEEKENRTNPPGSSKLHCRPRSVSPSTRTMTLPSGSNSRKNFMSPTISAASKICASPRKKLLNEGNNHNQPSVTCSDLRSSSSSVRSLCGAFAEQMEADHKDYLAQRNKPMSLEKENRRNQPKLMPASRNTKHFMSPTVSAASKISASPRKKILTESNGDQTCVTYSDLRSSCSSVNNITGDFATKLHDTKGPVSKKKVAFDPTVCIIPPVVSDPLQENGGLRDDELLDLECSLSSVKNLFESRESSEPKSVGENGFTAPYSEPESEDVEGEDVNLNSSSSVLPPLDADHRFLELSCDPETISLEPGTTDFCEGEIDRNPLDDGFIFDVFPDTEGTNEADFGGKLSELENLVDSEEMMTTKPEKENEVVEGKESPGRHFLTRLFAIFVVFIGFSVIMAINPQVRSYSMIKGPCISMVSEYEAAGYYKGSVGLTGDHLRHWGYDFISNIFGFMSNIKVEHKWGYICFQNLTASDETWCIDKQNAYHGLTWKADDSSYMVTNIEIVEHTVQFGELLECEEDSAKDVSEMANETAEESCAIEANVDQEVAGEAHEIEEGAVGVLVEAKNIQDEHGLHSAEWETEIQVVTNPSSQLVELQPVFDRTESGEELTNGGSESKAFIPVEEKLDEKSELDHAQTDEMVMDSMAETPHTSENEVESLKTDNMFSVISDSSDGVVETVINISLLALTLAISATLVCRKMKNSTKVATILEEGEKEVEVYENVNTSWVSTQCLVDMSDVQVSCSTAMSSSSSLWSKEEATSEVQRQHKRKSNKSLSLASSDSSLSPSYGSFTSYGMIPSRHRDGVEEMMVTPVRRSSRLRK